MDSTMGQDILLEKIQSLNCTLLIWKNGKKKKKVSAKWIYNLCGKVEKHRKA